MLPEVTIPDVHSYEQVAAKAKEKAARGPVRALVMGPSEPEMLRATAKATCEKLIDPILIGERAGFEDACKASGISFPECEFIEISDPVLMLAKAGDMVAKQEVELLVKGRILTGDMLKLLFQHGSGFVVKDKIISHVAVMRPVKYKKLLLMTDSAVIVAPDFKTKLMLIDNLVRVANSIGIVNPRVALLAAVEVIYPQMQVTMEAAILAKMWERGQIKGAMVDGPLSFDCAVDMFAAHSKGIQNSPVAGQADGMVAPNLETANGIYKGMALYGNCEMGGVIVGGRVPIALGSRSDTWQGKYNSVLLGVLNA